MSKGRKIRFPGFGLTFGYSVFYLSLLVLIPLFAIFAEAPSFFSSEFWGIVFSPRVLASFRLSFGLAIVAAALNVLFGLVIAWSLVRYRFPGRKIIDALIDLPFAMPTAVAGIALCALYDKNGWIGMPLYELFGVAIAYKPSGILVAMIFIGLPFVVRTVQPILQDMDKSEEEAALSLGANRWRTFRYVLLPALSPALITGFALALARAIGEYGSIIFIAGNIPMVSEIAPLLIITRLEQFDYQGAAAIGASMLVISFALLFFINAMEGKIAKRHGGQP